MRSPLENPVPPPPRLHLEHVPDLVYAVGDVHGCHDHLTRLERRIVQHAAHRSGTRLIVMLGDYIDRGPASAQVIEHLLGAPPAGFERICLRGNHEEMALAAARSPDRSDTWLVNGGTATLASYGIDPDTYLQSDTPQRQHMLATRISETHWRFIRHLPVLLTLPGFAFVHAGVRPGIALADQRDSDLVWIREPFLGTDHGLGLTVVHGHTPSLVPVVLPYRIGIDTYAVDGGVLTALCIENGENFSMLMS